MLERLGDPTISRDVSAQHILGGHPRQEAAGADHLHPLGKLPHDDRPAEAVVAMRDRVEEELADDSLVEGADLVEHQRIRYGLPRVPQIDAPPQLVAPQEETRAMLQALLAVDVGFGGSVLVDKLCLRKPPRERASRPEQHERRERHPAVDHQLRVGEELRRGDVSDRGLLAAPPPQLTERSDRLRIEVTFTRAAHELGGVVRPGALVEDLAELLRRHRREAAARTHQVAPVERSGLADRPGRHPEDHDSPVAVCELVGVHTEVQPPGDARQGAARDGAPEGVVVDVVRVHLRVGRHGRGTPGDGKAPRRITSPSQGRALAVGARFSGASRGARWERSTGRRAA